jgi:hypothetical protein
LLFGPGEVGPAAADILVGLWGNTERMGVVGLLVPEACRTRKGFVSELLVETDFGITSVGVGSSNGETTATQRSVQPPEKRRVYQAYYGWTGLWQRQGGVRTCVGRRSGWFGSGSHYYY